MWEVVGGRGKTKQREGGRGTGGAPKNMRPKQGGRIGNGAGAQPEKEKKVSKEPRIREACKKTAQACRRPACVQSICLHTRYIRSPSVKRSLQNPAKELRACSTACVPSICVCCLVRVRMLSHLRMLSHTRAALHAFRASVGIYEAHPRKEACKACKGMRNCLSPQHH